MTTIPSEIRVEVEKLERKHAENPEGRYFVPLANAYRKSGELDRAIQLLRQGLTRHPGYVSAHIVLGRCLTDEGNKEAAGSEYQQVLTLDPQNLVALRTLGELAAADRNFEEARRWYGELLAVDPMNEEARQALVSLELGDPAEAAAQQDGTAETAAELAPAPPRPRRPAAARSDDHPAFDGGSVVTETIAELYTRQGFYDRAVEVYKELIRRRGEDPRLQERLERVQRLAAGEEEPPPVRGPIRTTPAPEPAVGVTAAPEAVPLPPIALSMPPIEAAAIEAAPVAAPDAFADSFATGFPSDEVGDPLRAVAGFDEPLPPDLPAAAEVGSADDPTVANAHTIRAFLQGVLGWSETTPASPAGAGPAAPASSIASDTLPPPAEAAVADEAEVDGMVDGMAAEFATAERLAEGAAFEIVTDGTVEVPATGGVDTVTPEPPAESARTAETEAALDSSFDASEALDFAAAPTDAALPAFDPTEALESSSAPTDAALGSAAGLADATTEPAAELAEAMTEPLGEPVAASADDTAERADAAAPGAESSLGDAEPTVSQPALAGEARVEVADEPAPYAGLPLDELFPWELPDDYQTDAPTAPVGASAPAVPDPPVVEPIAPAHVPDEPEPPAPEPPVSLDKRDVEEPAPREEDDLETFQAWLRSLKR